MENGTSNHLPPHIPKPKPFHITEPFQERGLWSFWLAAADEVLAYVASLNCILQTSVGGSPFSRRLKGRVLFAINPRYDHEEAWVWIVDSLQMEAIQVELSEDWEEAIEEAHTQQSGNA